MANTPRSFPSTPISSREALDDTIEDSFPASDPPSSIPDPSSAASVGDDRSPSWYAEGRLARTIEEQTAKLPSDTFLWAAVGSMGVSAALQLAGKRHASLFVGQWAPAFLLLGVYNKLVKELGSDRYDRL
jgi:hypothetical protein